MSAVAMLVFKVHEKKGFFSVCMWAPDFTGYL